MRRPFSQQAAMMQAAVARYFPQGTRTSHPAGGYVLWG